MIAWVFFLFFHFSLTIFFPPSLSNFYLQFNQSLAFIAVCFFFFPALTSACYNSPNIFSAAHSFFFWPFIDRSYSQEVFVQLSVFLCFVFSFSISLSLAFLSNMKFALFWEIYGNLVHIKIWIFMWYFMVSSLNK